MVFIASPLGAQQNRNSVENKPASLLVVSSGKALNEIPSFLCGRQVMGPKQSTHCGGPSLTEDLQTEHRATILSKKTEPVSCRIYFMRTFR